MYAETINHTNFHLMVFTVQAVGGRKSSISVRWICHDIICKLDGWYFLLL